MDVEIKGLDIGSVVKVAFVLYVVIGIVVGVVYLIVSLIVGGLMSYGYGPQEAWLGRTISTGVGVLMIPLIALLYGVFGAIGGLIFAVLYNLIARTVGGVKIRLKGEVQDTGPLGGV